MKKIIYNNHICGLFLLTDLFEIKKGKGVITNEGKYPLITATTLNNGHGGKTNSFDYENCFTVVSVGDGGATFWHDYKFSATSNVAILIPKNKIENTYHAMYMAAIISSYLKPRYSYGRTANIARLEKQYIPLPIKDDGSIDFDYMESEAKPLMQEKINKIKQNLQCEFIYNKDNKFNINNGKKIVYNEKICGLFLLTDLFDISSGKGILSKEGKHPQITSTTSNNGHGGLTNKVDAENAFTITYNGFPGYCFWHNYKFGANSDCIIAKQKFKCNNLAGSYIAAIISSYLKPRYSYGRKASQTRLKNQYIPLPITESGDIDFEYMQNVAKQQMQEVINNLVNKFK
jgi:hypothetical protein